MILLSFRWQSSEKNTLNCRTLLSKGTEGSCSYTEIYQVLEEFAIYLLQKAGSKGRVLDVAVVEAAKGDIIFIPPDYAHITINSYEKVLKVTN